MATTLAWIVLGERLGPSGILGAIVLLGAIVFLSLADKPKTQP